MFSALHNLLNNRQLNSLKEEKLEDWSEVISCNVEESTLALIFSEVMSSFTDLLG